MLVLEKLFEFTIADLTYLAGLPDQHNKYYGYQKWSLHVLAKKAEGNRKQKKNSEEN